MTAHAALFRGINVGTAKRVAMADLREVLESLGYREVRTLLNSGNAVFTVAARSSRDHAARIETAFAARFGFGSRVTVLDAAALAAVIRGNPAPATAARAPSRFHVLFARSAADLRRLAPLATRGWRPEALAIGRRAAYLWCPDGMSRGRLAEAAMRAIGDGGTARNWATTLKLAGLCGAAGGE